MAIQSRQRLAIVLGVSCGILCALPRLVHALDSGTPCAKTINDQGGLATAIDFSAPTITLNLDATWLVEGDAYHYCLADTAQTLLNEKSKKTPKPFRLTADHPLLLDGLELTVPAGTTLTAPLLTVDSPFPVVLRNVRLTGNGTGIGLAILSPQVTVTYTPDVVAALTAQNAADATDKNVLTPAYALAHFATGVQVLAAHVTLAALSLGRTPPLPGTIGVAFGPASHDGTLTAATLDGFATGVFLGGQRQTLTQSALCAQMSKVKDEQTNLYTWACTAPDLLPTTGLVDAGKQHTVTTTTLSHFTTGLTLAPASTLTLKNTSIQAAETGLAWPDSSPLGGLPRYTLQWTDFVQTATLFASGALLPTDLLGLPLVKRCAATSADGTCAYDDDPTIPADDQQITSVGGVLPARYCEGTTADLLLYGQPVEKNDTNLWQHDSLCPVAPFPRAALVVPAGGDPATDGFPLPAGTCGFQCQLDEAQHPLALHPSKLIQLFGLSGTGPFTILETPITLQSLADMISAAGPLVDLPVPIVAGVDDTTIVPAGSDAGTILPGDESTETTIAQTETFDAATAPFDPGLPIGDPGLEYVETPANSSGGTEKPGVITAVTGDGADGLGSGIGGVGPVGGCTLMFRTAR